jgi:hypothetical protein
LKEEYFKELSKDFQGLSKGSVNFHFIMFNLFHNRPKEKPSGYYCCMLNITCVISLSNYIQLNEDKVNYD